MYPLPPAEVAQAHRVDVHGVQGGQGVGHVVPDALARGLGEGRLGRCLVPQDVPVDELHDVEGRAGTLTSVHRP